MSPSLWWLVVLLLVVVLVVTMGIVIRCTVKAQSLNGILKVKKPREGTVVEVSGGGEPSSWLEKFRSNSVCIGNNGTEFCDELLTELKSMVGNELPEGKTLIIQYYSNECPYCTRQMPIFNQILNEFTSGDSNTKYVFKQVNVVTNKVPGIKVVPSIIKFDGVNIAKYKGPAVYETLKEWILSAPGKNVNEILRKGST